MTKTDSLVTEKTTAEGREISTVVTHVESKNVSTNEKSFGTPERKIMHRHSERRSTSRTKLLETTTESSDWDLSSNYDFNEERNLPLSDSLLSVDSVEISYDTSLPAEKSTSYNEKAEDKEQEEEAREDKPQTSEEPENAPVEETEIENATEVVVETEVVEEIQIDEELEEKEEYNSAGGTSDPVMNTGESSDGFSFNNARLDDAIPLEEVAEDNFEDTAAKLDGKLLQSSSNFY